MDIGPGDVVEAIMDDPCGLATAGSSYVVVGIWRPQDHPGWPARGARWVLPCPCHGKDDQAVFDLAPGDEGAACSLLFRKRPPEREALFRSLLEPTNVKEDA